MGFSGKNDYYRFLYKNDIIGKTKSLLQNQGYFIREEDGRIFADFHMQWDTPWHHVADNGLSDCHTWHNVMFDVIGGFVPSECQSCFKVVVKPKTIKQLFALLDLELNLKLPSKCGIEIRESVFGLYGGYFYNRSLEQGLNCYKTVKSAMLENEYLSPLLDEVDEQNVPKRLYLKRGCTEFELDAGRSDQWMVTEAQLEIENLVNTYFVRMNSLKQPEHVLHHIHKKWIEFAYAYGDETYKEFTEGNPLYRPCVTYHYLAENIEPRIVDIKQEILVD